MTALAGLWNFGGEEPGPLLDKMLAAQAIYGRTTARALAGPVALGRRLWPLTPEDEFDRGPVAAADGALLVTADVRIDNRDDIASDLGLDRSRLAQSSDAALVARAVEHWGVEGLERLVGPFAVIVWDARRRQLILARDALGERPLHYHRGDGFVAVASMAKGLHAHPSVAYAADIAMTADFLALIPETGSESFFEGVARVPPGHIVTLDESGVSSRRYWNPDLAPLDLGSDKAFADALAQELDRAVACRLRRNVAAVGAHLSGGLDSSAVTATAARQLGAQRLTAFTAIPSHVVPVPKGMIGDEGPLAAATAALHPNIEHVMVKSADVSPVALMDRQFHIFERPVLNPSNAVWSEAINDAAQARGIGVLLTGQMGNFTISHDGLQLLPTLLRGAKLGRLFALLRQLSRRGMSAKGLAALTLGPLVSPGLWDRVARRFGRDLPLGRYSALRPQAFDALAVGDRAAARGLDLTYRPWANGAEMRLWGLRRVDPGVYNKGTLAGWGIDLRDPTADRRLVEFALRVPDAHWILAGIPRSLARRAFADRLPRAVLEERRRGLQGADWHVTLAAARPEMVAELDSFGRCSAAAQLVDLEKLRGALHAWPTGGWTDDDVNLFYRHAMLRGVAAGHFLRKVARTN